MAIKKTSFKHSPSHNIIRVLSKSGLCSRKQAVDLVASGRIKINGRTITDPGYKIRNTDNILFDEKSIPKKKKWYILFHKPAGYVTTRKDELNRPTVYEFFKNIDDWIFPIGRLDMDSEGLLILTNDTAFGNTMTDPQYKIDRTYEVLISEPLTAEEIKQTKEGIDIGRGEKGRLMAFKTLNFKGHNSLVEVTLREGKNREIRRIFERLNKPVIRLKRTSFGPFRLGNIQPGKWIELKGIPPEITRLKTSKGKSQR